MKKTATYCFFAILTVLIVALYSGGIAAADPSNTQLGTGALASTTTGVDDTALGFNALFADTAGSYNTATGFQSLFQNTTGTANTATGTNALEQNTTGADNTATGFQSLVQNTTGTANTATGMNALEQNTTGSNNAGSGFRTLVNNTTGYNNTATGVNALSSNTTGFFNTAAGMNALFSNTTGVYNTAAGLHALYSNTTGMNNIALGVAALNSNTTGQNNIGVGVYGGFNLTTGDNNIDIGNGGVAAEANTIRLGAQNTQTATYIAGITGSGIMGTDVVISNAGQLGVVLSSARYKKDIHDMGQSTNGLMKLRPVTFRYKSDEQGVKQYGLVAEEVETVYPELVVHDADGKVESVRYSMLTSMLLNELQKQIKANQKQAERIEQLTAHVAQQKISTEQRLANLERTVIAQGRDRNVQAAFNR